MRLSRKLTGVQIVCIAMSVELLFQFLLLGVDSTWADTKTYVDAWENSLSHFKIDIVRTPVYPLLLGFFNSIFGREGMYYAVAVFQSVISIISIPYLYKISIAILKSRKASFLLISIYALWPFITLMWSHFILTESLAASFSIFLVYCLLFLYNKGNTRYAYYSAFWLLILIFLRPIFVYLLPVLLVSSIFLWFNKTRRKVAYIFALGIIVNSLLLVEYMHVFKDNYGFFAVTQVSVINKDAIICHRGLVKRDYFATDYSKDNMSKVNTDINDFIDNHKSQYLNAILQNFKYCCSDSFFTDIYTITAPIKILVAQGWIVLELFFYLLFILLYVLKYKKILWIETLLFMLGTSNLIIIVLGAQSDYSRLLVPSKFIYLIMAMEMLLFAFKRRDKINNYLTLS